MALAWLAHGFDWCHALVVVQPARLIRWHRQGICLWWRRKSVRGRPPIPAELRALIRRMALDNTTWSQERIANEVLRSSTEFYRQFQAGETGDAMDYVEWASLVQMADNLHKRP